MESNTKSSDGVLVKLSTGFDSNRMKDGIKHPLLGQVAKQSRCDAKQRQLDEKQTNGLCGQ